jgi:hypothetical protein
MATLQDVVSELELQTEFINLQTDNMSAFADQLARDAEMQRAAMLESRKESPRSPFGGNNSGNAQPTREAEPLGDPVIPSKEAGIIAALGTAFLKGGLGIGAAAAGIGYLISQINDFGPALSRMSTGLEDLENTQITGEQFRLIGEAINDLASGAGIGGAIGLRILAGTAFNDLADGIERLNEVEFDPANLAAVGEGIDGMLAPLSGFDLGEAGVLQMMDDNLVSLAAGVDALAKAEVPSVEKMRGVGEGLNAILEPLSAGDAGEAAIFQMIDDNMLTLANGLVRLNDVDAAQLATLGPIIGTALKSILDGTDDLLGATGLQSIDDNLIPLAEGMDRLNAVDEQRFLQVAGFIGPAFQRILDGTDDLLGATGLQSIDDNLKPIADGIKYMTNVVDENTFMRFDQLSRFVGPAFQRMLDGTDNLLGATGLQAIDDNLKPMADGIKYMSDVGGEVDLSNVGNIVDAYNELGRMETISDAKVKRLAEMLGAVGPTINSQRASVISENTDPTGGGSSVVQIINDNKQVNTSASKVTNEAPMLSSPTLNNGSRADAYSAA